MPLGVVLKIPCQRIFAISDLGVPGMFFVIALDDCLGVYYKISTVKRQSTKKKFVFSQRHINTVS